MRIKKDIIQGIIQNKILQMNITRTVQEKVRRITNEILGGKVLSCLSMKPSEIFKINAGHVMCVCVCVCVCGSLVYVM